MSDASGDEPVLAGLRAIEAVPHGWGRPYWMRIVDVVDHRVDLELRQDAQSARIWIALPGSNRPMPWRNPDVEEADEWVAELLDWLNEEMDTVGLGSAVARVTGSDDVARIVADGYGFRRADVAEHQRLRGSVGPLGWHVRMSRSARKRAYAEQDEFDRASQ